MVLHLNFSNPGRVSLGYQYDKLHVHIKDPDLFLSASSFRPIEEQSYFKAIPTVVPSDSALGRLMQIVNRNAQDGADNVGFLAQTNLIVGILRDAILETMWGMVRALQMMMLQVLV